MKHYKILNFINSDGMADYKGLNVNNFVMGTQHINHVENYSIATFNDDVMHTDLVILSDEEYQIEVDRLTPFTPSESTIGYDELKAENAELKMAMAELAEQQMLADAETKLAMAELAEAMMGGVK